MACSSRAARSANASVPIAAEHLVRGAQLLARVHAPALAAQPFAVEQVGARELGADARAAEPLDRLAVEALGVVAVAQQRARARLDPQRPVGAARPRRLREPLERGGRRARDVPLRAAASISSTQRPA